MSQRTDLVCAKHVLVRGRPDVYCTGVRVPVAKFRLRVRHYVRSLTHGPVDRARGCHKLHRCNRKGCAHAHDHRLHRAAQRDCASCKRDTRGSHGVVRFASALLPRSNTVDIPRDTILDRKHAHSHRGPRSLPPRRTTGGDRPTRSRYEKKKELVARTFPIAVPLPDAPTCDVAVAARFPWPRQ